MSFQKIIFVRVAEREREKKKPQREQTKKKTCRANVICLETARCIAASWVGATCEHNPNVYSEVRTKLGLSDTTMQTVLDAIASSIAIPDIKVVSILGAGNYGMAVLVCNDTFRQNGFVIKFSTDRSTTREEWLHEADMQHQFALAGIAPDVLFAHWDTRLAYIVMDKLSGGMLLPLLTQAPLSDDILRTVVDKLIDMLEIMCAAQLVHQDLNLGNFGFQNDFPIELVDWDNLDLQVIDFGMSRHGKCDLKVDLASLIRGSFMDNENIARMRELLIEEYRARFPLPADFANDFYAWDEIYIDAVNANRRTDRIYFKASRSPTLVDERPAKRR